MSCFGEDVETVALRDRLNQTARYLCGVLGWLEGQALTVHGDGTPGIYKPRSETIDLILREIEVATPGVNPDEIKDWWEAHQEQDAEQPDSQRSAFVAGGD